MKTWQEHWSGLLRQRLPFLPLVGAAILGCLLGDYAAIPSPVPMGLALGFLGVASLISHQGLARWALLAGVLFSFATLMIWKSRESVAARVAAAWPGPVIVEVLARVTDPPRPFGEDRCTFPAQILEMSLPGWTGHVTFPAQIEWGGEPPAFGDRIRIRGSMKTLEPPRNPGAFDVAAWLQRNGVYSRIRVDSPFDATVLPQAHGFDPKSLALQAGAWMRKTLTLGLDPASDQARLIVAMTLGETSPFDDQLMEAFRETGTLHLFSVSGLHVGMLGMLLWLILSVLGIPNKPRALLIIALLFFYALVTGWKPASLRAATMGSFVLLGLVLNRPSAVLNSLLAAAFFLLISNPRELFNPGFQMSFLVVGSLILLCPPLVGWLRRPLDVDPFIPIRLHTPQESMRTWLAANLAPSGAVVLAAWCGSLALTFFYFHLISFSAIPANLVCVPLSFCVMGISVMALMSGLISSGLAVLFNNANWLFAGALLQSVQFLAGLPGAWVYAAAPELNPPMTRMTVFDFGAGAATAIESKGSVGLVDCGPAREFSKTLLPHLRSLGRSRLDWMILTHGDAGHLGAAREVLSACPPERLFESPLTDRSPTRRWLQSKIAERQLRRDFLNAGMEVPLTSAFHVECLYPPEELDYDTADDKALVLRASIGRWKVLFLSDAGPRSIEWLLAHASEHLKSDVVIKGAHRSGMAIPSVFWEKAQPAAVISTSHGFPRSELLPAETLRDLKRLGISLLRQDETGAVILTFRDESLHMRGYLNGAELTLGD